jgi:RNA polymerase sigma factor (sigma-70 family)
LLIVSVSHLSSRQHGRDAPGDEPFTVLRGMASGRLLQDASDERLLELIAGGEEDAFEVVVRRYRGPLVGYCRRIGLSESRAEDAVQQCFLSALLALRRGDQVRDLRAWLGRIAHNVAVNMLSTASARHERSLVADSTADERAIHIPDMDGGLAAREALAEVAALPPMQREALLQSALGGRTYEQVALSMGLSEGAVRGLLHRARTTLRSAAAIFSPLPLLRRVSAWLTSGGHSAGRVAELTAPGGSTALGGSAVRAVGAGLAAIAVAAAGVAVVPHGGAARPGAPARRSPGPRASVASAEATAGADRSPAPSRPSTGVTSSATARTGSPQPEPTRGAVRGSARSPLPPATHGHEGSSSSPAGESPAGTVGGGQGAAQVSSVASSTSTTATGTAPGGSGTVGETTPPPVTEPPKEAEKEHETESEEPGSDDKSESEGHEHEASEAERAEHESGEDGKDS